jgi:hypothetical protein
MDPPCTRRKMHSSRLTEEPEVKKVKVGEYLQVRVGIDSSSTETRPKGTGIQFSEVLRIRVGVSEVRHYRVGISNSSIFL